MIGTCRKIDQGSTGMLPYMSEIEKGERNIRTEGKLVIVRALADEC